MFGVYVHFPYCRKRCPYCDFAVSVKKDIPHDTYELAIKNELSFRESIFSNRRLTSLYIGGGTPSLWRPDSIAHIIAHIKQRFAGSSIPEITMEADPLDMLEASDATLDTWQAAGINRLSIGVQSMQDPHLKKLGRLHTSVQVKQAIEKMWKAGFRNISLDLMIGLPMQTETELLADLNEFLRLSPTHVSIYQLTVEPHTSLSAAIRKGKVRMPDLDIQASFYQTAQSRLEEAGFSQYEISSYALQKSPNQDFRSMHNRLYWNLEEYLGLGVSAHSFRKSGDGSGERFANVRSPERYLELYKEKDSSLNKIPSEDLYNKGILSVYERRSRSALIKEGIWLGLRQTEGIYRTLFTERHGIDPVVAYPDAMTELTKRGWLVVEPDRICLTRQGILFADEVALLFV